MSPSAPCGRRRQGNGHDFGPQASQTARSTGPGIAVPVAMPKRRSTDVHVASSMGTGAGRFLAAALLDALQGGAELIAVNASREVPEGAARGIDFTFVTYGEESDEVIRVGLAPTSEVVSAHLLRRSTVGPEHRIAGAAELERALHSAHSVAAMRWYAPSGCGRSLDVVLQPDRVVRLHMVNRSRPRRAVRAAVDDEARSGDLLPGDGAR